MVFLDMQNEQQKKKNSQMLAKMSTLIDARKQKNIVLIRRESFITARSLFCHKSSST